MFLETIILTLTLNRSAIIITNIPNAVVATAVMDITEETGAMGATENAVLLENADRLDAEVPRVPLDPLDPLVLKERSDHKEKLDLREI
jgi:hypothetical protein